MRDAVSRNKFFLLITGVILVLLAASYPGARWIDARYDVKRPLYVDRELAVWLLYEEQVKGGTVSATTIGPDQVVNLGNAQFRPSPGDTVAVKTDNKQFCVQVTSESGYHTSWQCWKHGVKPPQPNDTTVSY